MSLSGEQRPIDVTVLPPRQEQPTPSKPVPPVPPPRQDTPPTPPRKAPWWSGVAVPDVGAWLERPRVRMVVFALLASLAVGAVIARVRPPTVDGPVLPRAGWKAAASGLAKPGRMTSNPGAALDGDPATHWTTGRGQRGSDWFAVDMGRAQKFHQVVLDTGEHADQYPRAYAVYVSGDGVHWGASVTSGDGQGQRTIADFAPQTARYIKIVQTGQDRHAPWSLAEFTVH